MMKRSIFTQTLNLTLGTLLFALMGLLAFNPSSSAAPQAKSAQTGELPSAAAAKRILAHAGSPNIAKIKDSRKREAAQKSYDAIKAIANNTAKEREATLIAEADRAHLALKAFPQPKTADFQFCDTSHKTCMDLCTQGNIGTDCSYCAKQNNWCYDMQLVLAWIKDESMCDFPGYPPCK